VPRCSGSALRVVLACIVLSLLPVLTAPSAAALTGDGFSPLTPSRILDTRTGLGEAAGRPSRIGAGQVLTLQVTGRSGVPTDADAVVLNVTGTAPSHDTFLSIYPVSSAATPTISNLNLPTGRVVANLVTVKLDRSGRVNIYNALGSVDVVADVSGYYSATATDTYTPIAPHRVLDTRAGIGAPGAPLGPGASIDVQVAGTNGVPSNADAVVVNLTAVGATQPTYLKVFPSAEGPSPDISSLNVNGPAAVANLATVAVGKDGRVRVENRAGSLDVVADLAGYFAPDAGGSRFTPVTPYRLFDTRTQMTVTGLTGPGPGGQIDVPIAGQSGIPSNATGVVFNYTGTSSTAATYLEAYPAPATGSSIPLVSNVNLPAHGSVANLVAVAIGAGGRVRLRNQFGNVHMVVDVAGYYTSTAGIDHGAAPPTPSWAGVTLKTFVNNGHAPLGGVVVVIAETLPAATVTATAGLAGTPTLTGVANNQGEAFLSFTVGSPAVGRAVAISVTAASATLASSATARTTFTPAAAAALSADATNFMMDAQHSGSGTPVSAHAKTLWTRDFGNPITYPLIVGTEAFVNVDTPTSGELYSSHVQALDLRTGRTTWTSADISDGAYSRGLAYDQGRIFIGTNDLRALSASTGALDWIEESPLTLSDPPATYEGTLYLSGWGNSAGPLDCGGRAVAVNEATGAIEWTAGADVSYYCGTGSAPTVGPQGIFVYSATQTYGFSFSGQTMWHNPGLAYGGASALTPVLHGDQLWTYDFTWDDNTILSPTNGAVTRKYATRSAPVFSGTTVVDISGDSKPSDPSYLEARDASTGALLWHRLWNGFNQPFVAGSIAYTQLVGGGVDAFDVYTGALVWTGTTPPVSDLSRYQSMAAAHGVLLVPTDNVLTAFG
jgi:hypothetical protein